MRKEREKGSGEKKAENQRSKAVSKEKKKKKVEKMEENKDERLILGGS